LVAVEITVNRRYLQDRRIKDYYDCKSKYECCC
jgi:hypothetical protein